MNIDTRNIEHINSGDDRLILTQEMGRRIYMINAAALNAINAIKFSNQTHLLGGTVDLEAHYSRKNFLQSDRPMVPVSEQTQIAVDRVMQSGDFGTLRGAQQQQDEYNKVLASLDPALNKVITPETSEDTARDLVNATFAEIGFDSSIFDQLDQGSDNA